MAVAHTRQPYPASPVGLLIKLSTPRNSRESPMTSLKILIVEDEFFIALDAEEQAKALGHAVVGIAVSADEAIRMAGEEKPDVVLMDIRLVGAKDGIAAAGEIRSQYGIQSIFVTANTDPSTLAQAKAVGPIGVLEKPLTSERLKSTLALVGGRG